MPQILVGLSPWFSYEQEEVQELVRQLQELNPGYEIHVAYEDTAPKQGGGMPLFEAITISVAGGAAGGIAQAIAKPMANQFIDWMRRRFERRRRQDPNEMVPVELRVYRPIYGPNEEILQVVEVKHSSAEPTYPQMDHRRERIRERPPTIDWPLS